MTIDHNNVFNVDELHHEVLMQIEAIIFASDVPVSVARLKEAFQNQYHRHLVHLRNYKLNQLNLEVNFELNQMLFEIQEV